jgi:hypothetical protein
MEQGEEEKALPSKKRQTTEVFSVFLYLILKIKTIIGGP